MNNDPKTPNQRRLLGSLTSTGERMSRPDDRIGERYSYSDDLCFATEVALATERPLLLRGKPGSGKSTWAGFIAQNLGWTLSDIVVTANTEITDFFYRFDAIKRLHDAQSGLEGDQLEPGKYIYPGPFWKAFDPIGSLGYPTREGITVGSSKRVDRKRQKTANGAVVLIDEIDKADPSIPNGLLVAIASREFLVDPLDLLVKRPPRQSLISSNDSNFRVSKQDMESDLLIVITTNDERDLPDAFLRRCIVHELRPATAEQLLDIARLHFPELRESGPSSADDSGLLNPWNAIELFAQVTVQAASVAKRDGFRGPSTAEFLDLTRAWIHLSFSIGNENAREFIVALRATCLKDFSDEQAAEIIRNARNTKGGTGK